MSNSRGAKRQDHFGYRDMMYLLEKHFKKKTNIALLELLIN